MSRFGHQQARPGWNLSIDRTRAKESEAMHVLLQLLGSFFIGIGRSVGDLLARLLGKREPDRPVLTPSAEHPNRLRREWYAIPNPPSFFADLRWLLQEGQYEAFVRLVPHFVEQTLGLARDV